MKTLENSTKKKWQKPEIIFISGDNVNGGGTNVKYYEKSIQSSFPSNIAGYQYVVRFKGGGSGLAHHRKTFYHS